MNYLSIIRYLNPSQKYYQTTQHVKFHTKYKLFKLQDILIKQLKTNMLMVWQDGKDQNNMQDYDSRGSFICVNS